MIEERLLLLGFCIHCPGQDLRRDDLPKRVADPLGKGLKCDTSRLPSEQLLLKKALAVSRWLNLSEYATLSHYLTLSEMHFVSV